MKIPSMGPAHRFALSVAVTATLVPAAALAAEATRQPVIAKTFAQSVEGSEPQAAKAKEGAPNILWILLDDVGFGASSAFGGPIPTPSFERLANRGLRYTNFHTTGICSPTRAALLTGRNHHQVGMGGFPHKALSAEFPGYTGRLRAEDGTVAQYLREAGYSTYALGKWHLTPDAEITDLGPFDRWPSGKGFDHFFGFLGGAEDQYKPKLVEDNSSVKPDGRHLNAQLTDKAIRYIDRQNKLAPDRPFFLYYSTGAAHSPHQVDQPWLDKWRGKFDGGWDQLREETLARQKKLGIVPKSVKLLPRSERVPAWDSLPADEKKVNARFMEAYAAFLEYTDYEIGRLIDHLDQQGELDNTAIFVIIGDNGASKEGGPKGSLYPEMTPIKSDTDLLAEHLERFDQIGTAASYSNYPIGWAQALNTPFRQWKADANSEGGTRNPLIVSWPQGLGKTTGLRTQYGHVIDLLPTALELADAKVPDSLAGARQQPVQGISLEYSFKDAKAPAQHTRQYHLIFGAGGIIDNGWKASFGVRPDYVDLYATYPPPKQAVNGEQVWELYDLNTDFNESQNLAAKHPEKLEELKALFDAEAQANDVYPVFTWADGDSKVKRFIEEYRSAIKKSSEASSGE